MEFFSFRVAFTILVVLCLLVTIINQYVDFVRAQPGTRRRRLLWAAAALAIVTGAAIYTWTMFDWLIPLYADLPHVH